MIHVPSGLTLARARGTKYRANPYGSSGKSPDEVRRSETTNYGSTRNRLLPDLGCRCVAGGSSTARPTVMLARRHALRHLPEVLN